ncbi:MAG: hypothetical protein OSA84_04405 [Akkermansiaceae bacterium]|nr:hypothetical protein [Akkermansiaceae bacterium]
MKSIPNIISIALIVGGAAGFVIASRPLLANKEADVPLNVLGINRSPYGEIFAMAMQGPIDTYFHAAEDGMHKCDGSEACQHENLSESRELSKDGCTGVNDRVRHFIDEMASGQTERTNPRAATDAHKFYLRRGIEDKLRFAYNLDPSHYGNYNAYHLFLTEPELGTRPELTPFAAKLADQTISYCLKQRNDPRQALTAAAAAGNIIELMLNDRQIHPEKPNFTAAQMKDVLKIMDQSIGLYSFLANDWADKGYWENLSGLRLNQVQERLRFTLKIRDSHEQSIHRIEGLPDNSRTVNRNTGQEGSSIR